MTERIIAVAIRMYGPDGTELYVTLPPPARHDTILHPLHHINNVIVLPDDQGFITDTGRFVGRREAAKIATAAGQVEEMTVPGYLFSEDVW